MPLTLTALFALDVPDVGRLCVRVDAGDAERWAERLRTAPGYKTIPVRHGAADVVLWDTDSAGTPDTDAPLVAIVDDDAAARWAWQVGARTLLPATVAPDALAAALVAAYRGLVVVAPRFADVVQRDATPEDVGPALTPREQEVLALVAEGLPNKLIADRLGVSDNTAKFHVASLLRKLGAHSRTEAVIKAARLGKLAI
ncbi:MAG: response regulator transcription factor [Bacteroidota bacterium]